jgi:hypothetical protein
MELDDFLKLPTEEIKQYVPKTLVWAAGGTRRAAALADVPSDEYYKWGFKHQFRVASMYLKYGIQDVFMPILGPSQIREVGEYREKLLGAYEALCSENCMQLYKQLNARVRFLGMENMPESFQVKAKEVEETSKDFGNQTLWWVFIINNENELELQAYNKLIMEGGQLNDIKECIKSFYGTNVEPADIFIGFSKFHNGYWIPPFLGAKTALYWTDFPSYTMEEEDFKKILWDYAFSRKTWSQDKSHRYDTIKESELPERHEQKYIWGVGKHLGNFWYQDI